MQHHAFVIEAEAEEGISTAQAWVEKELGIQVHNNPDINILRFGLFSVADARRVTELAAGAAFAGNSKAIIMSATRAYHEAQNALLKVFEEPPAGTYLFLIMPSLGGLLPTLRSRVQILDIRCPTSEVGHRMSDVSEVAEEFLKATKEKRSLIIKKLTSGKDEEKRRENREEAIALVNGIEAAIYNDRGQTSVIDQGLTLIKHAEILEDIATLRTHLYDRSAPVKMILEHLSIVTPQDLH